MLNNIFEFQSKCYTIDGCDENFEFVRLKQSMEMVGFTPDKQQVLFAILSAVLLLGESCNYFEFFLFI